MKNHRDEGQVYNMSELQKTILIPTVSQGAHTPTHSRNGDEICRKCGKTFKDMDEWRKHLRLHTKFIPCKNFSSNVSDNRCSWGERCGYSHKVLEDGTLLCWDCGTSFRGKNELMIHRKNLHDVPTCSKFKTLMGCDKPEDACWYPHISIVRTRQPRAEEPATYANMVSPSTEAQHATLQNTKESEPKLNFPQLAQNKTIPLKGTEDTLTKTETILMEIMKQNKFLMESMMSIMQQSKHQTQMQQSQS